MVDKLGFERISVVNFYSYVMHICDVIVHAAPLRVVCFERQKLKDSSSGDPDYSRTKNQQQ